MGCLARSVFGCAAADSDMSFHQGIASSPACLDGGGASEDVGDHT
jgi:hypothetical protein